MYVCLKGASVSVALGARERSNEIIRKDNMLNSHLNAKYNSVNMIWTRQTLISTTIYIYIYIYICVIASVSVALGALVLNDGADGDEAMSAYALSLQKPVQ